MSIDRIGKGGPPVSPVGPSDAPSTTGVGSTGGEFKVTKSGQTEAVATGPLDRLRSGEISMSQYLDIKVDQATSHLEGRLSPDQLSLVRTNLRDQLSNDPALVDLVQAATGAVPPRTE